MPSHRIILNAVSLDKTYVNKLICLEVFGRLSGLGVPIQQVCSENKTNWERMESLWPSDMTPDEFFANAFAADSPGGAINAALGTIIDNDFLNTINYLRGLRSGTGKR
jgi:hypothetical protein